MCAFQQTETTSTMRLNQPILLIILSLMTILALPTRAAQNLPVPAPPVIGAKSYILIDGDSGHTLASLAPDERVAPASLTKLMTAYSVFKALDEGLLTLADEVTVSEKAWRTPGSRMFIEVGSRVTIQDLLLGMIVQSGNDASVALAEHVAGSESVFAAMMNQYAAALGMHGSSFQNSTGLPDDNHYSSARDLATLAGAIINDFPSTISGIPSENSNTTTSISRIETHYCGVTQV